MNIEDLIQTLIHVNGSDLHCKTGSIPRIRVNDSLKPLETDVFTPEIMRNLLEQTIPDNQIEKFETEREIDYAYQSIHGCRMRVNAYHSKSETGFVMRRLSEDPPTMDQLGLPLTLKELAKKKRGLFLVTGPTGSGKTTTLASMVDYINSNQQVNIVTMENPIEFLHKDKQAFVVQREIGNDSLSFQSALRASLRQDPDVLLVGEMRDKETVMSALQAAETGHLVLSTLHSPDAEGAIARILDLFPASEQLPIRWGLAESLLGVASQRLVKNTRNGRSLVLEILLNNGRVKEAIISPEKNIDITDIIKESMFHGMQSFDSHLLRLVREGNITREAAIANSTNAKDLDLELKRENL